MNLGNVYIYCPFSLVIFISIAPSRRFCPFSSIVREGAMDMNSFLLNQLIIIFNNHIVQYILPLRVPSISPPLLLIEIMIASIHYYNAIRVLLTLAALSVFPTNNNGVLVSAASARILGESGSDEVATAPLLFLGDPDIKTPAVAASYVSSSTTVLVAEEEDTAHSSNAAAAADAAAAAGSIHNTDGRRDLASAEQNEFDIATLNLLIRGINSRIDYHITTQDTRLKNIEARITSLTSQIGNVPAGTSLQSQITGTNGIQDQIGNVLAGTTSLQSQIDVQDTVLDVIQTQITGTNGIQDQIDAQDTALDGIQTQITGTNGIQDQIDGQDVKPDDIYNQFQQLGSDKKGKQGGNVRRRSLNLNVAPASGQDLLFSKQQILLGKML